MNRPLRLAECFVGVFGVFATHFVGRRCIINNPFAMFWQSVCNVLADRQQPQGSDLSCPHIRIRNNIAHHLKCLHGTFATCSFSVCYIFAMQKYGFCVAKVWFLRHKSMVFGVQKGGFYIAKTPFLKCNILNKEYGTTKCGIIYKVYCHRILMLNLVKTRCSGIMVWCAFWFLDMANTLQSGV